MVLKQSGALPIVFAKSNFENIYGLKTVGSATECFRQKQILSIEQFLSTKIFLTIEYTKF